MRAPRDLSGLIAYSRRLGADPSMIQAAGGNTSLKADGRMWIKASGRWLADIDDARGFVAMDLARIGAALADPGATDTDMIACTCEPDAAARPSVEVPMHAVIPARYVVHTHAVAVIAVAVRPDARAILSAALDGLNWAFLPYVKPGIPLSRAVAEAARDWAQVYVLANHGLIVAGDTLDEVDALTRAVLARLPAPAAGTRPVPPSPQLDLTGSGYRWARDPLSHQIAHDPSWTRLMATGSFVPDLLVFLGPALPVLDPRDADTPDRLRDLARAPLPIHAAAILPGAGVALREDAFHGSDELLRCARDVLAALPRGAEVVCFTEEQGHDLLNWDAEKYRQALNLQES